MRLRILSMIILFLGIALSPAWAADTSQTIAFRGCDATLAGTVDLRLRLFNAAAAGDLVYEETQLGIAVDAGNCISLRLGDVNPLAAGLFTTYSSLWVAFGLDADPDTELGGSRTAVTANGYAFRATVADNALTLSAGATISGDSGTAVLIIDNLNPAGPGAEVTGGHSGLRGSGGEYGLAGASSNSSASAAGVFGVSNSETGDTSGVFGQTNSSGNRTTGVFGQATSPSGSTTGVWGRTVSSSNGARGVFGEATATTGGTYGVMGISNSTVSGAAGVYGLGAATGNTFGVIGVSPSGGGGRGVWGRATAGSGDAIGVYGESSSSTANTAGVLGIVSSGSQNSGVKAISTAPNGNGIIAEANNGASAYAIWGKSAGGFAGFFDGKVQVNGNLSARVVQITGADFSEKFDVRETNGRIEPGMVVGIDPDHPGKLTLTAKAYDRRVAGIISGAGGINPGMLMGQPGTLADGDQAVAISGRVYVWADASHGPIAPGDLLTTSNVPGHAMKVSNYSKAQGAVLGKAMTGLRQGRGLVLVLVTLQ